MKIAITGGTGFIGSHLARKLDERGHDVIAASLNPEDSALPLPNSVDKEKLDVTDPDTIDFEGADVIIHLVGLSPLFQPSVSYQKVHVEGIENVVRAAEEADVDHFIHMSALDADPEASTEFLRTKGKSEELVEDLDTEYTILRPSVVFGDGDEFISSLKKATKSPVVPLPGGGQNRFQPIYVDDIAEIFAQLAESGGGKGVLEVGGPKELSMREIVATVGRSQGREPIVVPVPMSFVGAGLALSEVVPFIPFGMDQYRSLKIDNTVGKNDAERFLDNMTVLKEYLGE